jgi:uncharacterized protein YjbJ (UPF0337 family)
MERGALNNWNFKGKWKELKGKLKEKYGQLTDDDLMYEEGQEDQLFGKIQQRIGITAEQFKRDIEEL